MPNKPRSSVALPRVQMLAVDAPWLQPYREKLQALTNHLTSHSVAAALNLELGGDTPVRFVAHDALPAGEAYEAFIARTRCVPSRDNLHDLLNGLMWLHYPLTKRRLNELQSTAIARTGIGARRGALRDALTLFDENAALLQAPPELVEALRQRNWRSLCLEHRALWTHAELRIFGHALLEKLLQPYKAITAHVWLVASMSDAELAASLDPQVLATKPFLPLPVLGVPGWWAPNTAPEFYDDPQVFRAARGSTDRHRAPIAR